MEFVTFEIAKKLKEKGFDCELPFAMYNEIGQFCLLTTSAPYHVCESGYKYREYYDYNDFDKYDFIAPTISQVLKWLREEKKIHIVIDITNYGFISSIISFKWDKSYCENEIDHYDHEGYSTYEEATIAGIKYVLDNLI